MAHCPNGCSGHGKCGANDICACHQNWQGADCSLRTCPFERAFVDTAFRANDAHYYAECANKGLCDRKTGECSCFDGYEGKGCQRSTCPNACSGHGTCEFVDELANDSEDRRVAGVAGLSYGASNWDWQKIQGCKCDLGFEGADCSERVCAMGDDPLTSVSKFVHEKQRISIGVPGIKTFPTVGTAVTIAASAFNAGVLAVDVTTITNDYLDLLNAGDQFHIHGDTKVFTVMGVALPSITLDQPLSNTLAGSEAVYRVKTATSETYDASAHLTSMQRWFSEGIGGLTAIQNGGLVFELGFSDRVYVQQSYVAGVVGVHTLDKYIVITDSAATTAAPVYTRSVDAPSSGDQFFVTYYDPYGGMWNTTTQTVTTSVNDDATALQNALRSLPMRVLDDVTVSGYNSGSTLANGYHEDGSAKTQVTNAFEFIVAFQGTTGTSGTQHLFEVEARPTPAGAFPLSAGLFTGKSENLYGTSFAMVSKEGQSGMTSLDRSELQTCSNRGVCDAITGQCACFSGFRGLACEFQEALV